VNNSISNLAPNFFRSHSRGSNARWPLHVPVLVHAAGRGLPLPLRLVACPAPSRDGHAPAAEPAVGAAAAGGRRVGDGLVVAGLVAAPVTDAAREAVSEGQRSRPASSKHFFAFRHRKKVPAHLRSPVEVFSLFD
jgi:hypothetical protein